jgi:ABC-2 type transport system permease protein
MVKIFKTIKAEFGKYLIEFRTYYPDQIVSLVVTYILFAGFFLGFRNTGNLSEGFYIGFLCWYFASNIISESSVSISFEKQAGTFEQLLLKPVNIEFLCLIKTFIWLIFSSIQVVFLLLLVKLTLPIQLKFDIRIIPILLITLIGLSGFGLFLAALTLRYTKTASFESIISYFLLFFTGTIINVNAMPKIFQIVSKSLPLTQGIMISTNILENRAVSALQILTLCLNSFFYLFLGIIIFKIIYNKTKLVGLNTDY